MDAGYAIQGSNRRITWNRVIAWTPLVCIGLIGIEITLAPGKDFYAGRVETFSLVYQYGNEILGGLVVGMIAAAVISLFIFLLQLIWPRTNDDLGILPAAINLGLLVTFFLTTFLFSPQVISTIHRYSIETTPGHTYYLETLHCYGAIAGCPPGYFLKERYVVIDCPSARLTCSTLFISDPMGWDFGDPEPFRPYPEPSLRRISADHLQLIYEDHILWESS